MREQQSELLAIHPTEKVFGGAGAGVTATGSVSLVGVFFVFCSVVVPFIRKTHNKIWTEICIRLQHNCWLERRSHHITTRPLLGHFCC